MNNLNFLAGKNKDWLERNFSEIYSFQDIIQDYRVLEKDDVIVDMDKMRGGLENDYRFAFFTNFERVGNTGSRYIYDIYDVMFDEDGKIIGAVRAEYSGGPPKQEKYPVKHSRYTYSLKLRDFSILIEEPLNFMNWKDNPLR